MKLKLNIMNKEIEYDLDTQLKVIHRGYNDHDESFKYLYIVMLDRDHVLPYLHFYHRKLEAFISTDKDIYDRDIRRIVLTKIREYKKEWVLPE